MARYIDSVCRQCRREGENYSSKGTGVIQKNALWKENHTHREYMDRAAGRSPRNTGCSCARSKRPAGSTGFWKNSSAIISKKLIVNRA